MLSPLGRQCFLDKLPPDSRVNLRPALSAAAPVGSGHILGWELRQIPTLVLPATFPAFFLFVPGKARPCHSGKEISIEETD